MFQLMDLFRMQKFLRSSCPVCSSIVMMQEQVTMPWSWASSSNCSKHKRQTVPHISCTSHCVLGNKWYCCQMASARDKNSNHLLSNGETSHDFSRGSLSNGDPLLRLLLCFRVKTVYPCLITTYNLPDSI